MAVLVEHNSEDMMQVASCSAALWCQPKAELHYRYLTYKRQEERKWKEEMKLKTGRLLGRSPQPRRSSARQAQTPSPNAKPKRAAKEAMLK